MAIEVGRETSAIAIEKTDNKEKNDSIVSFTNISVVKEIIPILEKYAKKLKKKIEVVGLNRDFYLNPAKVSKNKLMIYVPINLGTFNNSDCYNLTILDEYTKKSNSSSIGEIILRFVKDVTISCFMSHSPMQALYLSSKNQEVFIAFAMQDEIVFCTDLISEPSQLNDEFMRKSFLVDALKAYEIMEKGGALNRRFSFDRRVLDRYMTFFKALKQNFHRMTKQKIDELQEEIYSHYRAVQKLERDIEANVALQESTEKRFHKNKHDSDIECVTKMLEPLLTANKYKTFDFAPDGQCITGYTHAIEITYRKKTFKVGEFKVVVKLDGTVTMKNLTSPYMIENDPYDHPHVHNQAPCLGNIKEQVQEMIKNFMFLPLFDLLHTYLCTYVNESGGRPYKKLAIGWGQGIAWCDNCDRELEECACGQNICRKCDRAVNRCECARCPSTHHLMEDINCNECSYQTEDNGCNYNITVGVDSL
jgi:hypothetical protein